MDIFAGSEGVAKAVIDGSHPQSVFETPLTEPGAFESEFGTPSKKKTTTGVVLQPTQNMMWSFVLYILLPFGLNACSITSRWMQRPDRDARTLRCFVFPVTVVLTAVDWC